MALLDAIIEWDKSTLLSLNQHHNSFWDFVMSAVTRKETWLPLYLTIVYVIARRYKQKAVFILPILVLTILAADQIPNLVKILTERIRPVHDSEIGHLVHNVMKKGGMYGFFSAHAANSFALLTLTACIFKRFFYTSFMFVWAAAICYSRIYLGVHYPTDILTGMLFGIILGVLMYRLILWLDDNLMRLRRPIIRESKIEGKDLLILWSVRTSIIATVMIIIWKFQHYNMI